MDQKNYYQTATALSQICSQINATKGGGNFCNSTIDIGNILNGSICDIQNIENGSNTQKSSAIQDLVNQALSLIGKLSSSESNAASEEVKKNKKAAEAAKKGQEKAETELNANIEAISGEVNDQSQIVIDSKNDLSDADEQIKEKQEEINEKIKEIQEAQIELACVTDPDKQKELLNTIQSLSGEISGLVTSITDIQSQVEKLSSNVEEAYTAIETAKGNAVEIQEDAQTEIISIAQTGASNVQANVTSQATAATNTAVATTAEAMAEAASSNIFTATSSAKLYRVSSDNSSAASTRTSGALNNLQTVYQAIGGLNNNASLLENFTTSIGDALNNFEGYIGSWNAALEGTITSIGSFETISTQNNTLSSAVESDLQKVQSDGKNSSFGEEYWVNKSNEQNSSNAPWQNNTSSQTANNDKVKETPANANGFETSDVELTLFEMDKK